MKHSLPSGAQRTCQSPKVSRTISITSGLAGLPSPRAAGAPARRPAAAPAGGRRRLGRWGAPAPRLRGPPACRRASAAAGGLRRGGGALLGRERGGQRQPEGGQNQAESDRLHLLLASPLIASRGDCHSPPRLSTAALRAAAREIAPK